MIRFGVTNGSVFMCVFIYYRVEGKDKDENKEENFAFDERILG